jgi:hypothetical protein
VDLGCPRQVYRLLVQVVVEAEPDSGQIVVFQRWNALLWLSPGRGSVAMTRVSAMLAKLFRLFLHSPHRHHRRHPVWRDLALVHP